MSELTNSPNHFLATLSPEDSDLLWPHLRMDELILRSVLYRAEQQMDRVYFPTAGIISLVVGLSDGQMIETGMLGRNGVAGGAAALDGRTAINQAIVQAPGGPSVSGSEGRLMDPSWGRSNTARLYAVSVMTPPLPFAAAAPAASGLEHA